MSGILSKEVSLENGMKKSSKLRICRFLLSSWPAASCLSEFWGFLQVHCASAVVVRKKWPVDDSFFDWLIFAWTSTSSLLSGLWAGSWRGLLGKGSLCPRRPSRWCWAGPWVGIHQRRLCPHRQEITLVCWYSEGGYVKKSYKNERHPSYTYVAVLGLFPDSHLIPNTPRTGTSFVWRVPCAMKEKKS